MQNSAEPSLGRGETAFGLRCKHTHYLKGGSQAVESRWGRHKGCKGDHPFQQPSHRRFPIESMAVGLRGESQRSHEDLAHQLAAILHVLREQRPPIRQVGLYGPVYRPTVHQRRGASTNAVRVATMHRAKGLEFGRVLVAVAKGH